MITKPLLAAKYEEETDINFDKDNYYLATPKIDGIRALKPHISLVSRSFKLIRNKFIREYLEKALPKGADGEILVGETFQETTSGVMREHGEPNFRFCWFDYVKSKLSATYMQRVIDMRDYRLSDPDGRITILNPVKILSMEEFREFEQKCLDQGHEGVILRDPYGGYKCGRSTLREGILIKVKRFSDSEGKIIGFIEGEHNLNKAEQDNFGRTKRSTAKAGKVKAGTLGKFLLRDIKTGVEFGCGTGLGLTMKLRQIIWDDRDSYLGQLVKYKYFEVGVKEKPRHPVFVGFRSQDDL